MENRLSLHYPEQSMEMPDSIEYHIGHYSQVYEPVNDEYIALCRKGWKDKTKQARSDIFWAKEGGMKNIHVSRARYSDNWGTDCYLETDPTAIHACYEVIAESIRFDHRYILYVDKDTMKPLEGECLERGSLEWIDLEFEACEYIWIMILKQRFRSKVRDYMIIHE